MKKILVVGIVVMVFLAILAGHVLANLKYVAGTVQATNWPCVQRNSCKGSVTLENGRVLPLQNVRDFDRLWVGSRAVFEDGFSLEVAGVWLVKPTSGYRVKYFLP